MEGAGKGNNPKREGSITVREELKMERNRNKDNGSLKDLGSARDNSVRGEGIE